MKKIIALILTVGMLAGSQVGMAAELNGLVVTDQFANEMAAVNEAKSVIAEIEAGANQTVLSAAADRCQNVRNASFDSESFVVTPVWVEKGNSFQKEYTAQINYNVSCDLKVNIGSL